jgi:hypothetical protein
MGELVFRDYDRVIDHRSTTAITRRGEARRGSSNGSLLGSGAIDG